MPRKDPRSVNLNPTAVTMKNLVSRLEAWCWKKKLIKDYLKDCVDMEPGCDPALIDGVFIRLKSGMLLSIKLMEMDDEIEEQIFQR